MSYIDKHVDVILEWKKTKNLSLTSERYASLSVLIEDYQKLKVENEALNKVLTRAASMGLAQGVGIVRIENGEKNKL